MSRRLLLLFLTSALALVLGFWTFTPAQGVAAVQWAGYWITLAAVILFAVVLSRSLSDAGAEIRGWRLWRWPVAVALLAAGFLHLHEPHAYKVVADEVVMQLTARQMHFSRESSVVVRGYEYAGNFTPLISYVDKRPLLFPFLVSALHDVSGFRPSNVFVLNGALSFALMLLLLLIGRRVGGWGAGIAAVLLTATIPLIAQNACGAGFEMLNLVMILLTIWLGMRAADQPANDHRLGAFVLSGVLLAQTRYESALLVLPVGIAVAYLWWRQRAVRLPAAVLAAPLLLVPCPLLLNVFKQSAAAWQLSDIAGADDPFALRYFYDNVGHALNFFLCVDGSQGNSLLVAVAGALGVGFFIMLLYRDHRPMFRDEPAQAVLSIFFVALCAQTLFMLCYFWGKWDDPVIRRLSLPTHLLLVLALVFVWPRLVSSARRWGILAGAALAYLVAFTIPSNAMHRFTQENLAARATNWLGGHIRAFGDQSVFAVDRNSGLQWFLYGKASATAENILRRPEAFLYHFRNRSFARFVIVQRVTPVLGTGVRQLNLEDDLGDGVELQTIEERAFSPLYHVRLSRIVAVDETRFTAWAKERQQHPPALTPVRSEPPAEELAEWLRQLP